MYIVVQTTSNKSKAGNKVLPGKMREFMIATHGESTDVTLDASAGKKLKQFSVDGAITDAIGTLSVALNVSAAMLVIGALLSAFQKRLRTASS